MKFFNFFSKVLFWLLILGSSQLVLTQNRPMNRFSSDELEKTEDSLKEFKSDSNFKNLDENKNNDNIIHTPSLNNISSIDSVPNGSSKGFGIAGTVMGIVALITLSFAFIFFLKRLKELERELKKSIQSYDDKKASQILVNKVEELASSNEELKNTLKNLQISMDKMEGDFKKNIKSFYGNSKSENPSIHAVNEGEKYKKPVDRSGNPSEKNTQVFYAASLSIDERGNLSIPSFELNPNATGFLFKVELDTEKGTGTYKLNPNAENIAGNLDLLRQFSDGVSQAVQISYKTVSPGSLKRIDSNWIVVKKLVLE